jgi:multidrug efflux pump subunit AcrA (membrane-fusion protein)
MWTRLHFSRTAVSSSIDENINPPSPEQANAHRLLFTVPGAVVPTVYGGKTAQITIAMDMARMQSKGVSPQDLLNAISAQNVVAPVGSAKIGRREHDVRSHAAPQTLDELNALPIKWLNGAMVYVRDVATVGNGAAFQTNVVRQDGKRGVPCRDRLRLYVPVPEVYASLVHYGGHLTVTSDALPNETFTGIVVRNADAIAKTSRTLNVEVYVENAKHRLLPGQYAFVHLPIPAGRASMTLPANTLLFRAEGLRVGVVRGGHVHLTPIQIGNDYGATVEVTAGLQPTDKIIINPADSLAEGAAVRIEGGQAQ